MFKITSVFVKRASHFVVALSIMIGILVYAAGAGTAFDSKVERLREGVLPKNASGEVVVVGIDQASLSRIQAWPWPRSLHGRLVDRLREYGASKVIFDVDFTSRAADASQDRAFAEALRRSKAPVYLIGSVDAADGNRVESVPTPVLRAHAHTVSGWISVDTDSGKVTIPYAQRLLGKIRPSIAAIASNSHRLSGNQPIDWSIGYHTIPQISYADVLEGAVHKEALEGKVVIVGATAMTMGDRWTGPDGYRIPGVIVHAMGAETLIGHEPVEHGALPLLLVTALLMVATLGTRKRGPAALAAATIGLTMIGVSWVLREQAGIVLTTAPAIAVVASALVLQLTAAVSTGVIRKVTTNDITDLPNLTAMRLDHPVGSTIAVRLRNHLDTATALGPKVQADLLRRARDRIRYFIGDVTIYQVDEHSFAWRTTLEGRELSDSVEGLVALFVSGIHLGDRVVDAPVTAGIAQGDDEDVQVSVTAALLAADHAARQGLPWTRHEDNSGDAEWRVTMMSELDRALDGDTSAGRVWVAYQPKYDLRTDRILGSEALVRWTHPQRGPIRPDHFIPLLEEAGRIERLTLFVLETAIRDFAAMGGIGVAVNLSTRMLGNGRIVAPVRDMLAKYGLPAHLLTLEITESAELTGESSIDELAALRARGVNISIDDYGTGQSTLNYLKRLPASELKIDQSFVRVVLTSRSDQVMINSTIGLAHELGLKVVAEGVETADVLEALRSLDCDIIQGYHIGKPMPLEEFVKTIAAEIVMPRLAGSL